MSPFLDVPEQYRYKRVEDQQIEALKSNTFIQNTNMHNLRVEEKVEHGKSLLVLMRTLGLVIDFSDV